VRVVLIDHGPANADNIRVDMKNFDPEGHSPDYLIRNGLAPEEMLVVLRNTLDKTKKPGTGSFQVKWLRRTFLNSIWIRDASIPENAMASVDVSFYGTLSDNPVIRFGRLSPRMIESLRGRFEHIWEIACDNNDPKKECVSSRTPQ
jgi:hypothetical protein